MSIITLHFGQCGNQISETLFSNIHQDITNSTKDGDYYNNALNKWFHISKNNKWIPRSILIDTENKTFNCKQNLPYQFRNVITKATGGSANNWAFGYTEKSKLLIDEILECTRKEVEKTDFFSSFLNIFSSSGGTGSGLGSFVIETLKNDYPNKTMINSMILPYLNGELITQSYNTLLTLSKIYSISDAIVIFENDRLHYNCINSLSMEDVNFSDINNLLSKQLLHVYQPLKGAQSPQLLSQLCENSQFKLLQIRYAPLSKMEEAENWISLLNSMSRQSRFDFQRKNLQISRPKNLSSALVCRGVHNPTEQEINLFKNSNVDISSNSLQIYHQKRKIFNLENSLSLISNSNSICAPLNLILEDGRKLYKYKAYLHHYQKFGVDESCFDNSFQIFDNILRHYKKL